MHRVLPSILFPSSTSPPAQPVSTGNQNITSNKEIIISYRLIVRMAFSAGREIFSNPTPRLLIRLELLSLPLNVVGPDVSNARQDTGGPFRRASVDVAHTGWCVRSARFDCISHKQATAIDDEIISRKKRLSGTSARGNEA